MRQTASGQHGAVRKNFLNMHCTWLKNKKSDLHI